MGTDRSSSIESGVRRWLAVWGGITDLPPGLTEVIESAQVPWASSNGTGIETYAMLDVWMALGGDPDSFDRMWHEEHRTPADTWSQILSVIRGDGLALKDTNPPAGPEFEALIGKERPGV